MAREFDENVRELMDRPQPVSAELERDLINLVSLNRNFGAHRLLRRFLAGWFRPERAYRVLDLCSGAGDLPRAMIDWGREHQITIRVDAVDANPATVQIAKRWSAAYPEIDWHEADVLTFDPPHEYDLVHCSLALHHFSDENAALLLKRCKDLTSRYALVADLVRDPMTTAGVWLLTSLLYREAMTVHDARLSARRAFSFSEMRSLIEVAGWENFGHGRFMWGRQAVWTDVRGLGDVPVALAPNELPDPA